MTSQATSFLWTRWLSLLQRLAGEIDVFLGVADKGFLELVDTLDSVMHGVNTLSTQASESLEQLDARLLVPLSSEFQFYLEQFQPLAPETAQSGWGREGTGRFRAAAVDLHDTRQDVEELVTALNAMGVTLATRITDCAVADAQQREGLKALKGLGITIASLTIEMRQHSSELFDGLDRIMGAIDTDRARRQRGLQSLVRTLGEHQRAIDALRKRAAQSQDELETLSASTVEAIDGIVRNAQFHDITRQRLQHIRDSLLALASTMRARYRAAAEDVHLSPALLRLQREQLRDTKEEYEQAMHAMIADVGTIEGQVQSIAQVLATCGGVNASRKSTLVDDLNDKVADVLAMVEGAGTTDDTLTSRLDEIGPMALELQQLAQRALELVEQHDTHAERLYVECPDGLDCCVLRSNLLRKASMKVATLGQPISTRLGDLAARIEGISSERRNSGRTRSLVLALMARLREASHATQDRTRTFKDDVEVKRKDGARLGRRLAVVGGTFGLTRRFERVCAEFTTELMALEREVERHGTKSVTAEDLPFVDACSSMYTMEAERAVLVTVMHAAGHMLPVPARQENNSSTDGHGQNVEFF